MNQSFISKLRDIVIGIYCISMIVIIPLIVIFKIIGL